MNNVMHAKSTIFLCRFINDCKLRLLHIMPCYPEPSDGCPERTREGRKWVEEAIINDLIDEFQDDISKIAENQIGQRQLRKNQLPEAHGAAVCGRWSQRKNHAGRKDVTLQATDSCSSRSDMSCASSGVRPPFPPSFPFRTMPRRPKVPGIPVWSRQSNNHNNYDSLFGPRKPGSSRSK